jgi:hypothetical protein
LRCVPIDVSAAMRSVITVLLRPEVCSGS